MKVKIALEKKDLKKISVASLNDFLKHFNNENTEAYFKRMGDERIEIIISKRNEFKEICESCGINYFDNKEDYINWLKNKNGNRKTT